MGLADDAMQEEPLGKSYTGVEGIALDKRYRAYLDAGGSSLSGDWEVDAKGIEYLMLESELKPVAMPASTKGDADV